MAWFYQTFFYKPLLNGLVILYQTVAFKDLGVAIIFLTIIVRLLLFPLFQKAAYNQTILQRIQPHVKKIKEKHKGGSKEKEYHETMELFKEHNITPFAGLFNFFFLFIQLPVMIALFHIAGNISGDLGKDLYNFVLPPASFNDSLLGLINLKQSSMVLVILAAILFYVQGKIALPRVENEKSLSREERFTQQVQRQMVFTGPIVILIAFSLRPVPATVPLYLLISTAFSLGQQVIVNRQISHGKLRTVREENN